MESIFQAFCSEGYDWAEFHVYRHPRDRRKYVTWTDSGCSCHSYEDPSIQDLEAETPLGKREVYAKFTEWFGDGQLFGKDSYTSGTKIDNLERLRKSL